MTAAELTARLRAKADKIEWDYQESAELMRQAATAIEGLAGLARELRQRAWNGVVGMAEMEAGFAFTRSRRVALAKKFDAETEAMISRAAQGG